MPLKKLVFKPGLDRETTRYTSEGGWYDCDKIRFRSGSPEKIGGWEQLSPSNTFQGTCRSLWAWATFAYAPYLGVGTNLKYYIMYGGAYNDITPIRATTLPGDISLALTIGSNIMTVTDVAHGCETGDFVTFSGATGFGGNVTPAVIDQEYQVTVIDANTYTVVLPVVANTSDFIYLDLTFTSNQYDQWQTAETVVGTYQLNAGNAYQVPISGWGGGAWGLGPWGVGSTTSETIRIWNAQNFGEDLIFGPKGGGLYYWDATTGLGVRGVALSSLGGAVTLPYVAGNPVVVGLSNTFFEGTPVKLEATAGSTLPTGISSATQYYLVNFDETGLSCNLALDSSGLSLVTPTAAGSGTFYISVLGDVPLFQNLVVVSDASRIVLALGTNDYGSIELDPMLIRWSDTESAINWTTSLTNQAGSVRLSHGSEILAFAQVRQEILVWTDTSLYSLQYIGPPIVWSTQLLADNVTILNDRAMTTAAGVTYWMGEDKFYMYDGRVQTLPSGLRQYVFSDFNLDQVEQVFACTVERFNEVWWFYPSAGSITCNKYVVYNYVDNIWYYGNMTRTAWIDASIVSDFPISAYNTQLLYQEIGVDDASSGTNVPIEAYITTSEFDIEDGHNFGFVWRVLPDITFRGSTAASPQALFTLLPLQNSGSGYNDPESVAGSSSGMVTRSATVPVEQFTGQVNIRVRGRQMAMKVSSTALGVQWQLGAPRIDIKPDGRKS
jgi:hypothetical protein